MQNLRKCKGTFKGCIGEFMFNIENTKATLTHFCSKYKFLKLYENKLNIEQKIFLEENWYSIDALEVSNNQIILYEIKTKNWYNINLNYKFQITKYSYQMYKEAEKLNFIVKLAIVRLFDNWNFCVNVKNFYDCFLYIDKDKKYDNKKIK